MTDQRRPDEGVFRIAIVSRTRRVRDVFEVLAADVSGSGCGTSNAKAGITEAVRRLEAWRACLKLQALGFHRRASLDCSAN